MDYGYKLHIKNKEKFNKYILLYSSFPLGNFPRKK